MELATEIANLKALEEIRELKARRDRAADTKDWALYASLHVPEHRSINGDYPPWTSTTEMIANVSRIMSGLTTLHHSHSPDIEFESPLKARGIWAMKGLSLWRQGEHDHWFLAFGHYFETYEKRNGTWLFTSREVKYHHTIKSRGANFPPSLTDVSPSIGGDSK